MKMVKKFASVMLVLVMALSMATGVFAASTGSITVENPMEGQTYTAYKIFDVLYNEDYTAYSYTIDGDSEWISVVQTYAGTENSGLTLTKASSQDVYVVTIDSSKFSAGAFSSALKAAVTGKDGIKLTVADGKASVSGLDLGYYFVTSSTGALCNLTTTTPDATIRDKNDVPFEKTADDVSVELGQVVNYSIDGKVPDTTGFTTYTYKITDTMTDGLTFNKDVKVVVGTTDITADCTIAYADSGFELTIPVVKYQNQVGEAILITYSAIVNENAVASVENNKAQLEYTNNPDGSTTKTPEEIEKVYSAEIVIDKYDAADNTKKLAGAEFVLYKKVTDDAGNETELYYKVENSVVSWVADQTQATVVTTDGNGVAEFEGLEDGTYFLKETKAPAGFNLLEKDVKVVIAGGTESVDLSYEAGIENNTGTLLPETGGMGTTLIYVIGGCMILGAAVLLVVRRRMSFE